MLEFYPKTLLHVHTIRLVYILSTHYNLIMSRFVVGGGCNITYLCCTSRYYNKNIQYFDINSYKTSPIRYEKWNLSFGGWMDGRYDWRHIQYSNNEMKWWRKTKTKLKIKNKTFCQWKSEKRRLMSVCIDKYNIATCQTTTTSSSSSSSHYYILLSTILWINTSKSLCATGNIGTSYNCCHYHYWSHNKSSNQTGCSS